MTTRRQFIAQAFLASAGITLRAQRLSSFATQIHAYAEKQKFSGVILLGCSTKILERKAFGIANRETNAPITSDTVFEGGSISKWIASIVVMRQVDQGKLSLDLPIAKYLPAFRKDNAEKLTLAHLMSHQSGVPNQVQDALRSNRDLLMDSRTTPDEAVVKWASGDLQFAPGSQWDYSHSNWLLVQAVLEHVTGRTYEELAAQTLWKPLNLDHSGIFHGASLNVSGMAESRKSDGTADPSAMPRFMAMAGGFYTTAAEMLQILDAVDSGKVLSNASTERLFTVRMPEQHYALGGRVRMKTLGGRERAVIWEDGSNRSFRMLAVRVRGTGESVVIANNNATDPYAEGDFADAGLKWLVEG